MQISIAHVFGVLAVVGQATPLPQTQSVVRIGHDAAQDQSVVRIGHDREGASETEPEEEPESSEELSDESSEELSDEPSEEPSDEPDSSSDEASSSLDEPEDPSSEELSDEPSDEVGTSTVFVDSTEIISATISDSETTSNAYRNLISLMSLGVVGISVMTSAF